QLLDVTEVEARLLLHPFSEADLERAMIERRERAEREPVDGTRLVRLVANDEHHRLVGLHGYDCSVQSDCDAGMLLARKHTCRRWHVAPRNARASHVGLCGHESAPPAWSRATGRSWRFSEQLLCSVLDQRHRKRQI